MSARAVSVAVLDDYQGVAKRFADWETLGSGVSVRFFEDHVADDDDLAERLAPFHVICAMRERTRFPGSLLRRLPNLELLVTSGRRNAAIDVDAATERGVTVCGTNSPGHATAELAMALLLSLARNLHQEVESVRSGGWQLDVGRDLRGAALGIIGLGRLGGQVAAMAAAFGMETVAWSQNLTEERCREVGARLVSKAELLQTADFITIHLRLSERTRGLIGASELALMKQDAYLVNTSRGPIVDEDALAGALEAGDIGGAALDVFDREPLPSDHPLRTAPRLLVTPHIGYVTRETYRVFYGETVEAIAAFLRGSPVRVIASPKTQ